jgi:hypothetical protein
MANHGRSFEIIIPDDRIIHRKVSSVDLHPSGAISVWNTDGKLVRTYGPLGYLYFDEIFEIDNNYGG